MHKLGYRKRNVYIDSFVVVGESECQINRDVTVAINGQRRKTNYLKESFGKNGFDKDKVFTINLGINLMKLRKKTVIQMHDEANCSLT